MEHRSGLRERPSGPSSSATRGDITETTPTTELQKAKFKGLGATIWKALAVYFPNAVDVAAASLEDLLEAIQQSTLMKRKPGTALVSDARETLRGWLDLDDEDGDVGGAHDDDEFDVCKVCCKSTLDENGEPQCNVLICDDCDDEVHFACSGLSELPDDDEGYFCGCTDAHLEPDSDDDDYQQ